MKKIIYFVVVSIIFIACDNMAKTENLTSGKQNTSATIYPQNKEKSEIELYLLKEYQREEGDCTIIEESIVTEENPIITSSDFLSYNTQTYIFGISEKAKNKLNQMQFPVNGTAFALMVDGELIYTGYFYPSYSSSSCNWLIIDPLMIDYYGGLKLQLGYPSLMEGTEITDRRNDERILNIYKN